MRENSSLQGIKVTASDGCSKPPAHARYKSVFVLAGFIFSSFLSVAQDLHFSQFFNSPLTTNPANTGFIPDADYRIGANYRSQWVNVLGAPYKTMSVWGDAQVFRDRFENGWLGVGGVKRTTWGDGRRVPPL